MKKDLNKIDWMNLSNKSKVANLIPIGFLQIFPIILIKPGPILNPSILAQRQINSPGNLVHLLHLFLQSLVIDSNLSDQFIPKQAEYKLRLWFDTIMFGYFWGEVGIDFDDLQSRVIQCQFLDIFIGLVALGVPFGVEVDHEVVLSCCI
jgi:hypothetical protein